MPYFTTGDNQLWYDDWNHTSNPGPPLFFLHGFTANRNYWGYQKDGVAWRLANVLGNYRCIFMETRGCHESNKSSGPFNIQQQANDVIFLCKFLNIERFTYCGHSMGGGTGFQLATSHPEMLHKLVLMAPIPSGGFPSNLNPDPTPPRKRTHLLQHTLYPSWTQEEYAQAYERYEILAEGRVSDTKTFFNDRAERVIEVSKEYWIQSQHSMNSLRLSDKIEQCTVPTLIIAGATDSLLKSNVEDSFRMPDCVLHVSGIAGHETALHDPIGVSLAIHNFMQGNTISQNKYKQKINNQLKQRGYPPKPPYPRL
jgi:pimeloyl-ACP methyl ester carboxylesterase|tara:strand:- start:290 stop:1222 length:933 start_codon:yes stop_codon:yes gene_type:complete